MSRGGRTSVSCIALSPHPQTDLSSPTNRRRSSRQARQIPSMLISRPDPADDQAEADEDSAVSTSLAAAPEEDPARTSFILSHPSLSVSPSAMLLHVERLRGLGLTARVLLVGWQLSRKVQFSAPPSYHALLGRVLLILAPSHFKPSQLCFSYIDAQLKRHLVKDQTDLEKLYDGVGKGEDIRLKLVVREGGRMGLKECDKALRKLFVSKSVISEARIRSLLVRVLAKASS